MNIAEQKNILRSEYKSKIKSFVASENQNLISEGIQEQLKSLLESLAEAKSLGVYAPLKDEVDWRPHIPKEKYLLGYPVIDNKEKTFEYFTTKSSKDLGVSLKEEEKGEKVNPDVLLIPGLAFDEEGYRLGRGGGYYDRLLEDFEGVKIGIVYSCSFNGTLPRLDHDKPVDYIVTEKACIKINR